MNENIEILNYIYKNSEMGYKSSLKVLTNLNDKENIIKNSIETIKNGYRDFKNKSKRLIKNENRSVKKNKLIAKIGSNISINMEMNKDNSDPAIAHIMIQGLTMGIVDIESKINRYESICDKSIIKFAKDYLLFQNKSLDNLKNYL